MAEDIMNKNLYELLHTEVTATLKEIKTAYRKAALSCHPDKNPNNPRAAEIFHELSKALEILTDTSARAAYDKVFHAREQARIRTTQLDSKRRKLKEDLEAREEAYRQSRSTQISDEKKLRAEIERLRKEGSKQVEEEVAFVKQRIREQLFGEQQNSTDDTTGRVKIKWKAAKDDEENGGYNYDILHQILSKHGDISVLIVSTTKKGRAIVEYKNKTAASTAVLIEIGLMKNPLTLQGLWEDKKSTHFSTNIGINDLPINSTIFPSTNSQSRRRGETFPSYSSAPSSLGMQADAEFENSVLNNLRRVEERRRLIEKMKEEDES